MATVNPERPVAIVAGAAQGIGYLVAKQLSKTHRVALVDVNGEELERAARECGPDAVYARCDLIEQDQVDAAIGAVLDQTGGIDVVMSGAGIGIGGSLRHTHPDVVAAMMNINVSGNWRFIHGCLPSVIERRGYILGVASGAAIAPTTALGGYCASKAGLEMLLEVLRLEVAHLGVDVGIAYFMFHDTQMVRVAQHYLPAFERTVADEPGPMHGIYPPEDAANAVVHAIEKREHKAFSPPYLGELSASRMALRTKLASLLPERHARDIDELTARTVSERGPFHGATVPTVACRAAARSVGREIEIPDDPFDPTPAPNA